MPHPENLIPAKKGEIRNPKGKPPGTKNRATILRKWIDTQTKVIDPSTGETVSGTMEDKVYLALLSKALSEDVAAIKEINDTLYGKIADKAEIKTDETIKIKFVKK